MRVTPLSIDKGIYRRTAPEFARFLVESYWRSKRRQFEHESLTEHPPSSLFVWVPKTAGSAIARWLRKLAGLTEVHNLARLTRLGDSWRVGTRTITFGHQNVDSLISAGVLSAQSANEAFSFSVVRNPYSRAISLWLYLVKINRYSPSRTFDQFIADVIAESPRPGLYNQFGLSLASPMTGWVRQKRWSGPQEVFRFEEIDKLVASVSRRLSIKGDLRPRNTGPKHQKPVLVSQKTLERLMKLYRADFDNFGYDPHTIPDRFILRS